MKRLRVALLILTLLCPAAGLRAEVLPRPAILDATAPFGSQEDVCAPPATETPAFNSRELFADEPREDQGPQRGAVSRFMRAHGWRLLGAAGLDKAADVYTHQIGPSNDPLLFKSVPRLDRAVYDAVTTGKDSGDYFSRHGLETFRYGSPLALLALDLGDRGEMAGDLFGAADAFFLNRGLTSFSKAIIGRKRPTLEFADPNALSAKAYDDLQTSHDERRSFPSGHSSGSFTWATYIDTVIARKFGTRSLTRKITFGGVYSAAAYIAYTRLREGEHYLTDVIAGASLGIWVSRSAYRAEHDGRMPGKVSSRRASPREARVHLLAPHLVERGAAVTLGIRLGESAP